MTAPAPDDHAEERLRAAIRAEIRGTEDPVVAEKIATWLVLQDVLNDPRHRRDVCFVCEQAPICRPVLPGAPVGVCRGCDTQARAEQGQG